MNDIRQEKIKSNLCANIGLLLTLLNLVVSSAFLITGSTSYLLIFTSVTAIASLVLSICGHANANKSGRGKAISIIGIVINAIILATVVVFIGWLILFLQSCSNVEIK